MRNLIIIIAITLVGFSAQAQWKIGPKAALGSVIQGEAMVNVIPMSDHGLYDLKFKGGSSTTSAGIMMFNDLGPFFLQADILGTQYALNYQLDGFSKVNDNSQMYEETYYIIESSFTAGVLVKNFKFGLGPVLDLNIDKDTQLQDMYNYQDKTQDIEFGFQALIGYNWRFIHLDLRYTNKFSGVTDSFGFGSDVFKFNGSANRLSLGLGIAF